MENKILQEHTAHIFLSYDFTISVYGKTLKMKRQRKSTKEAMISRFVENHYNGDILRKFMVCELCHKEIITFS
jgi:hypothetical protein